MEAQSIPQFSTEVFALLASYHIAALSDALTLAHNAHTRLGVAAAAIGKLAVQVQIILANTLYTAFFFYPQMCPLAYRY